MNTTQKIARYVRILGFAAMLVFTYLLFEKWVLLNYLMQSDMRNEIISTCIADPKCRSVRGSSRFERDEARPTRIVVVQMHPGTKASEARSFGARVTQFLEDKKRNGGYFTARAAANMLPVEVRHE